MSRVGKFFCRLEHIQSELLALFSGDLENKNSIYFDGEFVPGSEYDRLADLPSKEELLGKLVSMLNSPLQKLVSTINAPIQNTLGALSNLKENKS